MTRTFGWPVIGAACAALLLFSANDAQAQRGPQRPVMAGAARALAGDALRDAAGRRAGRSYLGRAVAPRNSSAIRAGLAGRSRPSFNPAPRDSAPGRGLLDALGQGLAADPRRYDNAADRWRDFWDGDYRDRRDESAKAYRDAAIATAIIDLIGTIITQNDYAPAPPAPRGHYERRAVVVEEARYVQEQVWVPPLYDRRTGRPLGGGYYETRTRLVPEVVQYEDVWVAE